MKTILLCTDMDRTLIPNGAADESPRARPLFFELAGRPDLKLAYVTGRHKALVKQAIRDFSLPEPDYVIGDVGTTLYHIQGDDWRMDQAWRDEIGRDWHGQGHDAITALLSDIHAPGFELQDLEKQNQYKISYYTALSADTRALEYQISKIFADHGIAANLIWSRDDAENIGLLDILPRRANKVQAIRFLMASEKIAADRTVFAGDSGNDLDALTSGLNAILVRNAAADVRQAALDRLAETGGRDCLYLPTGDFFGLNGNYAAGILEGLVHFFPWTARWVEAAAHDR
jgi:HAD superfamily hydrolase (TIGR01484 family)